MAVEGSQVCKNGRTRGGCRQGAGMDQFCFTSATGSDLIRCMGSSAGHYLPPLQSLYMLCSLSSQDPIFWPPGKVFAAKMWWNQWLFWFCVRHSIWPYSKENPRTPRIFGSSYTGVSKLGNILNWTSRLCGLMFWCTAGTIFSQAQTKGKYSSVLLLLLHRKAILLLRYPAKHIQKRIASKTSIRVGFW